MLGSARATAAARKARRMVGAANRTPPVASRLEVLRRDGRLRRAVQPLLEVLAQPVLVDAAELLGQRDEHRGVDVAVAVLREPRPQDVQEGGLADDLTQALERRAA